VRLNKFEIVAGVPPAAGSVDGSADRLEIAENVVVSIELRRGVGRGGDIVEVAGRGAERRGNEVLAVAFVLIEAESIGERLRIELLGGADWKCGRRGGHRAAYFDCEVASSGGSEVDREDVEFSPDAEAPIGAVKSATPLTLRIWNVAPDSVPFDMRYAWAGEPVR
jgi:hypothetical protein